MTIPIITEYIEYSHMKYRPCILPNNLRIIFNMIFTRLKETYLSIDSIELGGSLDYLGTEYLPKEKFTDIDISLTGRIEAENRNCAMEFVSILDSLLQTQGCRIDNAKLVLCDTVLADMFLPHFGDIHLDIHLTTISKSSCKSKYLHEQLFFLSRFSLVNSIFWFLDFDNSGNLIPSILSPELNPDKTIKRYLATEKYFGQNTDILNKQLSRYLHINAREDLIAFAYELFTSTQAHALTEILKHHPLRDKTEYRLFKRID